jgi:PAS domain S-box-containing protein
MLLFSRDISERMRALRDEAVRSGIRHVLENVPVAITITRGKEHRIDMQNQMSLRLLNGRNVEGMLVKNALPEVEEHGFLALLDQVYATGKAFEGKEMPLCYDRDGSGNVHEGCFDVIYQPLYETDGQVSGIVHVAVEVTEQVQERQLLSRFAAERDATLRQLVEGVILTDAGGRISFVNDAARRLHGVAKLDVLPEHYTETYSLLTEEGDPYPPVELPLARAALRGDVVTQARWKIRRPDGTEILVEGNAQPIHDEQGCKIAAVLTLRQL